MLSLAFGSAAPASASGDWTWPVVGPLTRGFDPPDSPFGSGHRGIDIAAQVGTPVRAAADGIVTFAGPVGGRLFLTIDHGAGLESTYSWVDTLLARRGDVVTQGQVIARSGTGHAGSLVPHLHMGVRLGMSTSILSCTSVPSRSGGSSGSRRSHPERPLRSTG